MYTLNRVCFVLLSKRKCCYRNILSLLSFNGKYQFRGPQNRKRIFKKCLSLCFWMCGPRAKIKAAKPIL